MNLSALWMNSIDTFRLTVVKVMLSRNGIGCSLQVVVRHLAVRVAVDIVRHFVVLPSFTVNFCWVGLMRLTPTIMAAD